MNICLVTLNSLQQPGGLSTYYSQLCSLLTEAGHRVYMLVPDQQASKQDEDQWLEDGLTTTIIFRKTYITEKNNWSPYFRPGGFDLPNWIAIGIICRNWLHINSSKLNIDIVQVPDYGGTGAYLTGPDLPPVLVFGHGCLLQINQYNQYNQEDEQLQVLLKAEKLAFSNAAGIATHSALNKAALEKLTGRSVALTLPPWKEINRPVVEDSGEIVIASSLQPVKGALVAAEAIALTCKTNPELTISWYGDDTASGKGNQSVARQLSLSHEAIWNHQFKFQQAVPRARLLEKINAARFVVIPSQWETFSWVAIEAASMGKAIIITDQSGASGLFTHEVNALIIQAGDPQKLAEAMISLYTDPVKTTQLGAAARELITCELNASTIVHNRIDHFASLLNNEKQKKESTEIDELLSAYKTITRKLYYRVRAFIKKIVSPDA